VVYEFGEEYDQAGPEYSSEAFNGLSCGSRSGFELRGLIPPKNDALTRGAATSADIEESGAAPKHHA
jgi:hypothetical protein